MKLRVLSDLHLEFAPWKYESKGEDLVVLSGDICSTSKEGWARRNKLLESIAAPVLMTLGNHEYYGTVATREDTAARHMEAISKYPHVKLLDPGAVDMNGIRFIGATLWTDFLMCSNPELLKARVDTAVNDFLWMRASKSDLARTGPRAHPGITSGDMLAWHVQERLFIERSLKDCSKAVVITHFMPHPRSVAKQYEGNILNGYFGSDLSSLFKSPIKLWIHGHTHTACDYEADGVRVVANPRGYPGEKSHYVSDKIIEV